MSTMRISIWQQWASNHSGGFTVVGTFESSEWAVDAADEVRQLLQGLADWYSEPANREILERGMEDGDVPFAPIEKQFMAKHKISETEWNWGGGGIDWITEAEDVDKALSTLRDRVFITNPDDTWMGAKPMNILLWHLGADQVLSQDEDSWIGLNLAFTVPDETSAEAVVETFETFFKTHKREVMGALADVDIWEGKVRREGARVVIERGRTIPPLLECPSEITARLEGLGFQDVVCSLEEFAYE